MLHRIQSCVFNCTCCLNQVFIVLIVCLISVPPVRWACFLGEGVNVCTSYLDSLGLGHVGMLSVSLSLLTNGLDQVFSHWAWADLEIGGPDLQVD